MSGSIYQSYGSYGVSNYGGTYDRNITMHSSRYGNSTFVKQHGTGSSPTSTQYSYSSSTGRKTYTDTTHSRRKPSHSPSFSIPTGNTSSNAKKFEYSNSTYPETRKPPSGRSRALPLGPGPQDSGGNVLPLKGSYRVKKSSDRTEISHKSPVKGNHDYDPNRYTSNSRPTTPRHSTTSTTSSTLRTNSPLRRGKHFGSVDSLTNSISNTVEYDYAIAQGRLSPSSRTTESNINKGLPYINQNGTGHSDVPDRISRRDSHGSDRDISSVSRRPSSASKRSPSLDSFSRDSVQRLYKTETDAVNYSRKSSEENDYLNNNKGLLGLRNLGNTCYMNCMLQGLSNTRELREYLYHGDWKNDVNRNSRMRGELIKAFASLVKKMWGSGGSSYTPSYVSPTDFRAELTRYARRFAGYLQQDAQEFLIFLIEGLHEDVNRVQKKVPKKMLSDEFDKCSAEEKAAASWKWYTSYDDSFMVDLFVGQLKSSLECLTCGYVSNTFDPFWEIPLPLKKKRYGIGGGEVKLSDCFDEFTREETLDGDERPTCERCKKRRSCKKKFSIWKFPKILILHLKRFDPMSSYPTKLGTHVDFPLDNLNLATYSDNPANHECTYDLYSVSNHSGTARGGHYTAYTKHPYNDQWHHFNDQSCTSINRRAVVSSQAYVLFYERQFPRAGKSHL